MQKSTNTTLHYCLTVGKVIGFLDHRVVQGLVKFSRVPCAAVAVDVKVVVFLGHPHAVAVIPTGRQLLEVDGR